MHFDSLPGDTFARLAGVKSLIEHTDKSIPEMERQAEEALKTLAESEGWDFADYDVETQVLRSEYGHWVPRYASYSAVVLLCSVLETQLLACAERIGNEKKSFFRAHDIKGSGLEAPIRLICALTGVDAAQDPSWSLLKDVQTLRNIIVHRGGVRGHTEQHQKEFDDLLARYKERISSVNEFWSGDSLWIPVRTCRFFASEIEQFFKRFFKNLDLPADGVSSER